MNPPGPSFYKPRTIIAAKNLSYAALFMGVLAVIIQDATLGIAGNGGMAALILTGLGFLALIFLVRVMSQCVKWARTALVVLYVAMIFAITDSFFSHPVQTAVIEEAVLAIQGILLLAALVFLFTPRSNLWFNSRDAMHPGK